MAPVTVSSLDKKLAIAKKCSHEGVMAGAKAAIVASVAAAVPTLASVRMLPWARTNLNHTAQALIISTVAGCSLLHSCRQDSVGFSKKEFIQQYEGMSNA